MLKTSKLHILIENLLTRYKIGGLLVGDQITFLDSIKKNEHYKTMSFELKQILDELIQQEKNGDVVVKVIGLNTKPFMGGQPQSHPHTIDIGIDSGGGRFLEPITIPGHLISDIQRVTNGNNVPETIGNQNKIYYDNNPEVREITPADEEGSGNNVLPDKQQSQLKKKKSNK